MAPADDTRTLYDVAILGSGFGGSLLATILARQGLSVLVLEAGSHPHFAIGEALIPETGALLRTLADRFSVPEIEHLSCFHDIRRKVTSSCGIKKAFSFVYHREQQEPVGFETTQFPTLAPPWGADTHFFRQDIDAYVMAVAVRYGATIYQQTKVEHFELNGDTWHLEVGDDVTFQARYLVDGCGYRSPVAQKFGLRQQPTQLRTDSRAIFTHMVGVQPFDCVAPSAKEHRLPVAFGQSTMHHLFDGGWMWVIPFDNTRTATNPLCSVGLVLDRRKHPETGLSAEQEIEDFLDRYPGVAHHLEGAKAVRPWISTGRIQYSSEQVVGDRFCLLPHSAGFIDPLFSSGISMTVAMVGSLARRLLTAVETDDFATEHFQAIEDRTLRHLRHFDRVVSNAYDSFADFSLWNAWFRIWVIGNFYGAMGPIRCHLHFLESGDPSALEAMEDAPYTGLGACQLPEYTDLLDAAEAEVAAARRQEITPQEASERIFSWLRQHDIAPPQFQMPNPEHRSTMTFTALPLLRFHLWSQRSSLPRLRELYYDRGMWQTWKFGFRTFWAETLHGLSLATSTPLDMFRATSRRWRRMNSGRRKPKKPPITQDTLPGSNTLNRRASLPESTQ